MDYHQQMLAKGFTFHTGVPSCRCGGKASRLSAAERQAKREFATKHGRDQESPEVRAMTAGARQLAEATGSTVRGRPPMSPALAARNEELYRQHVNPNYGRAVFHSSLGGGPGTASGDDSPEVSAMTASAELQRELRKSRK
jgi:hypothetical protein